MARQPLWVGLVLCCGWLAACGSDSSSQKSSISVDAGGGTGGTVSEHPIGDAGGVAGNIAAHDAAVGPGDAGQSDAGAVTRDDVGSDAGDEPTVQVPLRGRVFVDRSFVALTGETLPDPPLYPLADAHVRFYDAESFDIETHTGADGRFVVDANLNSVGWMHTRRAGYLGALFVAQASDPEAQALHYIPRLFPWDEWNGLLEITGEVYGGSSTSQDPDRGVVFIEFRGASPEGGEGARLANAGLSADEPLVMLPDASGFAVSQTLLRGAPSSNYLSSVTYANVAPGETHIELTGRVAGCTFLDRAYPVIAGTYTYVSVDCGGQ